METEVPAEGHVIAYVRYLLRYAIADRLGRRPTVADLQAMARRGQQGFAQVVRGDAGVLEDVLRTAFDLQAAGRMVTGGTFGALGIPALGVILDDPVRQLAEMKPHLAAWWHRKGQDLVRDGVRSRGQPEPGGTG